jgi:PPIC-type PPIASE domain
MRFLLVLLLLAAGCPVFTADDRRPEGAPRPPAVRVVAPPAAPTAPAAPRPVPSPAPPPPDPTQVATPGARHILIRYKGAVDAGGDVARERDAARARAEEALGRIRSGEDFATVARDMSEAEDAARGGDLGPIVRGRTHPALVGAVNGLPVGGISDVVESPYGFHVIQRYR